MPGFDMRGMRASPLRMAGAAVELPRSFLPQTKRSPGMGELLRAACTGVAKACRPMGHRPSNIAGSPRSRTEEQEPGHEEHRDDNSSDELGCEPHSRCLTFDMRGMRQQAKPNVACSLNRRVRHHWPRHRA